MDAAFWADVINNIFAGFGLLFGQSVSDRLVETLESVTTASTFIPNPDLIIPFVQAIGFLALLLATPVSLINLTFGALTRRPGYISRSVMDFVGTYMIAAFGLTIYSALAWIVNSYNEVVATVAKNVTNAQGQWFDVVVSTWNLTNPAGAGFDSVVAKFGGWLLDIQMTFLNLAILPSILLLMLAFIFRDGTFARVFLTLAIATILITLLARAGVATWLAFCVWLFSWVPAAGGSQTTLLAVTMVIAGSIAPTLFIVFISAASVTRTKIMGGIRRGKGGEKAEKAEKEEAEKQAAKARQRAENNPAAQPGYSAASSQSVRDKAQAYRERGQEAYEKGKNLYASTLDKTEKTQRIAHTVVMVSSGVQKAAPAVGVKFAHVPYVVPVTAAVTAAATGVKKAAEKVENSATAVLGAERRMRDTFRDTGSTE